MVLVIWLNENVHFHVRFLAMPKLMQAWFWSSGLTKTFFFCANSCQKRQTSDNQAIDKGRIKERDGSLLR
jgi:hypothetical protein